MFSEQINSDFLKILQKFAKFETDSKTTMKPKLDKETKELIAKLENYDPYELETPEIPSNTTEFGTMFECWFTIHSLLD